MNEKNLREKNEHISNLYVAKVMMVCAGFTVLALVLNMLGIFILKMSIVLPGCLIGLASMVTPTIILYGFKKNEPWLKYVAIICSCIFVMATAATLGHHVFLMCIFPLALASMYFDPKLNIFALVFGCIAETIGQILPPLLGTIVDNNFETWYKLIVFSLPVKILMMIALGYIFISLGKNTNRMMGSLMDAEEQERIFTHMKKLSEKSMEVSKGLSESVETLTNVTHETKKNNEEISDSTNVVVGGIQNSMEQLSEAEENSAKIYDSIQGLVGESEKIGKLFENVENLSNENKSLMQNVTAGMEKMKESTDVCQTAMQQLEEKTKKIDGIVSVIADISDQTNLLSLNAAIESARAGEQGKGFAVVSEEIRKLSQQTQNTLNDVRTIIGEVLEQNSIAVEAMNSTAAVHEEQKEVILSAEKSAQGVMTATREMTEKMNLITNNTKHIEFSTAQIVDVVNLITRICQENQESLQVVTDAVHSGNISIGELEGIVGLIYEMSHELSAVIES